MNTLPVQPLVLVKIDIQEAPRPAAPKLLPFIPFAERFEGDGQWLMGRMIAAQVCRHMQGMSVIATLDHSRALISLPELPTVYNEIDRKLVSIYWTIPEELRALFNECLNEALTYRTNDMELLAGQTLGCHANQTSVHQANAILRDYENSRIALNNPTDPPLSECLADRFGLNPGEFLTLPYPFRGGA